MKLTKIEEEGEAVIFSYQRLIPNPSTVDIGQPSGAETFREISSQGPLQDDLVDIFRRMFDLGSPEYEHDLANYIHNGYPSLAEHYDRIHELDIGVQQECDIEDCICHCVRCDGKSYGKADVVRESQEAGLVTNIIAKVRAEREAADRANEAELLAANANYKQEQESGPFDFQCYNPNCEFATNIKSIYERHCVTRHPGRPGYAGHADLKLYGWKAQGRKWEV